MSSISLSELKELAKKYSVSATGSKATIAQTLNWKDQTFVEKTKQKQKDFIKGSLPSCQKESFFESKNG